MRWLSFCAAMGLLILAGCKSDTPVVSNSPEIISVDPAFHYAVNLAMIEVHNELANWIVEGDKRSDPSYHAGSRSWKTGDGPEANKVGKVKCSRSFLEFHTNKDIPVGIETVFVKDRSLTVLINCENQEEAMRVHNVVFEKVHSHCASKSH